jgi:preprotein translocase subunit SecG
LWIVYRQSWSVLLIPLVLLAADLTAGLGFAATVWSLSLKKGASIMDAKVASWLIAFFTLTLALNLLCTGEFSQYSLL